MQNNIFTNTFTTKIQDYNSDYGVLLARSLSFAKPDISRYFDEKQQINEKGINVLKKSLEEKHRSIFYLSNIQIKSKRAFKVNAQYMRLEDLQGYRFFYDSKQNTYIYTFSLYLALNILYYRQTSIFSSDLIDYIEQAIKTQYLGCYKALLQLPKENLTDEDYRLLDDARSKLFSFEAEMPIFVARQLYRHRGINYTEVSRRYTDQGLKFYTPNDGLEEFWRKASDNPRDCSIENYYVDEFCTKAGTYETIIENNLEWYIENTSKENVYIYETTTSKNTMCGNAPADLHINSQCGGIAKEMARMILPQSQIVKTANTCDLYTLSSIFAQRLDKHAQKEIRALVDQLYELSINQFGKDFIDNLIKVQKHKTF